MNELLYLSNNDIPFIEAQTTIHQPTLKEIAMIGEDTFFNGVNFLNFDKNRYQLDTNDLEKIDDFEIFIRLLYIKKEIVHKESALKVLMLLFPNCDLKIEQEEMLLIDKKNNSIIRLNSINFEAFKQILIEMFCLKDEDFRGTNYNLANNRARKIAEKIRQGREKVAKAKGQNQSGHINLIASYVSILSIGTGKSINELMNYTLFQLKKEMKRYGMKYSYDLWFQSKLAGAKGIEQPKDWMMNIFE